MASGGGTPGTDLAQKIGKFRFQPRHLRKPTNEKAFQCSVDGKWEGGSLSCIPVSCPAVSPVAHATPCPSGTYDPPSTCHPGCEQGYVKQGSGTSCTCGAKGTWNCVNFACNPVGCPAGRLDEPLPHGASKESWICPNGHYGVPGNNSCSAGTCKDGYRLTNENDAAHSLLRQLYVGLVLVAFLIL